MLKQKSEEGREGERKKKKERRIENCRRGEGGRREGEREGVEENRKK